MLLSDLPLAEAQYFNTVLSVHSRVADSLV